MTAIQCLLGGLNLNPLSDEQVLPLEKLSEHSLRDQGLERYKWSAIIITVQDLFNLFKKKNPTLTYPQKPPKHLFSVSI